MNLDAAAAAGRRRKRLGIALAAVVLLAGVGLFVSAPVRSYQKQQAEARTAEAEQARSEAHLASLKKQIAFRSSDAEVEARARADLGFVMPGEEAFSVIPAPQQPTGLPSMWPFTGTDQALAAG